MLRSAVTAATRSIALRPAPQTIQALRSATTLAAYYPKVSRRLPTKYGGVYTVTLIPGDGVGAEITDSVKEIFEHVNAPIEWEQYDVSGLSSAGESLFKEAMESLKRNKVGLKGILYTPIDRSGHNSWNVAMRQQLDIYASVVLCKSIRGFPTRHNNVDFAIIRENTEGEYAGLEHQSYPGVVENLKVTTRAKSERIIRFAFDFALKNNRKKVTCVHKANIMKLGDGLFLNTFRQVAEEYKSSGIQFNDMIVDNTSMQLVAKPGQFDVMVMPNLYGAIISNIGAALVGGPGIVPGCNVGRVSALL
ncbi:isocitrate dehydrogenase (NAD(+)) idh1 [Ceratobasidium sp. 392]|nr:isocitrate dehydrogenase (NAD(+)) idh1 [Ceratobasidium sp. 392]